MRDRRTMRVAAGLLAAILWAGPGAAQGKPDGVKLARAGYWALALIKLGEGSNMCAAGTRDMVSGAVFDYVVIDGAITAFRVSGAPVAPLAEGPAPMLILQVDRREAIAVQARVSGETAVLTVDNDAPAKRQFVRDMAGGERLEVRQSDGALVGAFRLGGADKVLRAFGLCVARLPKKPQG